MDLLKPSGSPGLAFRLGPIPVRVDVTFFLGAAFLGWRLQSDPPLLLSWMAIVFVSVLWHELGHALAFRRCGNAAHIQLHGLGGLTWPVDGPPLTARRDLLVSLAGPASGFALGGLALYLGDVLAPAPGTLAAFTLRQLVWANVAWGVFNLLPILPLDGGRMLAAAVALRWPARSARVAGVASVAVAAVVAVAALLTGFWFAALFLGLIAWSNVRGLRASPPVDPARGRLAHGYERLAAGDLPEAERVATELRAAPSSPGVAAGAARLLAWSCLLRGRIEQAADALESAPSDYPGAPVLPRAVRSAAGDADAAVALLRRLFEARPTDATGSELARALAELGRLDDAVAVAGSAGAHLNTAAIVGHALFQAGRYDDAVRVSESSFGRHRHPATAYNLALTCLRLNRPADALSWLAAAVDAGYRDLRALDTDPALAPLRGTPPFEALRRSLA